MRRKLEALVREALTAEILTIEPIAAGLGARRFFRLTLREGGVASAIARVEAPEDASLRPPGVAPEPALEPLRSFLEERGIPVPRSYISAPGIEVLEDLGDASLESFAAGASEDAKARRYGEACEIAARLQQLDASPDVVPAFGRRLDDALFRYKAEEVIAWTLPFAMGRAALPAEAAVVREAFRFIADECAAAPQRFSHRDYKAANLMFREGALVLIDLQGALLAPPEYDFVCLLRDSHVPLREDCVRELVDAARPTLPDPPSPAEFDRRFTLLTLTRVGKDLSRYLYAAQTRGDERYLRFVPTACGNLRHAAAHAADWDARLTRLAELFGELPDRAPSSASAS